jgi:C1A family cysteine protease
MVLGNVPVAYAEEATSQPTTTSTASSDAATATSDTKATAAEKTTAGDAKASASDTSTKTSATTKSAAATDGDAKASTSDTSTAAGDAKAAANSQTSASDAASEVEPQATTSSTDSTDESTQYSTGLASDPAANAKQKALNDSYDEAQQAQSGKVEAQSTLPSKYDLRNVDGKTYVDATRQQGNLGDCWANSLSSCVASNILKQTGGANKATMALSARQISWNIYKPVNPSTVIARRAVDPDQYGEGMVVQFGDGTNSSMQGAQILSSWQGLASETGSQGIPFQDSTGNKAAQPSDKWAITEAQRDWSVAHVTDAERLPSPATVSGDDKTGEPVYAYNASGTDAVKKALVENGAVQLNYMATIPGDPEFNEKTGAQYISVDKYLDYTNKGRGHSVTIIGWDDDYSASNFSSAVNPGKNGAFLVKNSWGSYGGLTTVDVTFKGKTKNVSKSTYDNQSVYLDKQSDSSYIMYPIRANGFVDTEHPIATGLKDYNKDSSLSLVCIDGNGKKYTVDREMAAGTEDSPTWDGCFWISYYDATIKEVTSFKADVPAANASGTYKYTHEYLYDYLGTASMLDTKEGAFDTKSSAPSGGTDPATIVVQAANVFTAKANEALSAVTAVTQSAASTVRLAIYRLISGATSPTQSATGAPELTMTVTEAKAGYHTVDLSKLLYFRAGESFSVVETITNLKGAGYLPIELGATKYNGNTWTAKSGTGESYISTDGGKTWFDASTLTAADFSLDKIANGEAYAAMKVKVASVGNVMIRALTTDWTPVPTPAPATETGAIAPVEAASQGTVVATVRASHALPATGDATTDPCMLLVLFASASLGVAACARRRRAA